MMQSRRDQVAENVVKKAIFHLFGRSMIDKVDVIPATNEDGEAALSVVIYLTATQKPMAGAQLLDTIAEASTALRGVEDYRFPYVTFLVPGDESAEDTRPAA